MSKRKATYQSGPSKSITKKRRKTPSKRVYEARGEWKFHDISMVDSVVSATASIVEDSCCAIAQGITESQRIGRKCTLKSINFRYQVNLPEKNDVASANAGDNVRVILYQDRQCNGAAIATTDLLESGTNYQSFNNLANSGRFRVLMDRTHTINYQTMTADALNNFEHARVVSSHSWYKSCSIPIEFSSTTGAISEITCNNIGVLVVSSDGVAEFIGNMRVRFSDN